MIQTDAEHIGLRISASNLDRTKHRSSEKQLIRLNYATVRECSKTPSYLKKEQLEDGKSEKRAKGKILNRQYN